MLSESFRRWWPQAQSWLVVAVPPATVGLATFVAFGYAAVRMRSRLLGLAAVGYLASLLPFALSGVSEGPLIGQAVVINFMIGTVHMLLVRPRLARALVSSSAAAHHRVRQEAAQRALRADPVYREALLRHERRDQARDLLARDPELAAELQIGRPDLPRMFDDGGLVDVNRVPASVIAELPGFTAELAQRVVSARGLRGGFLTAEDLVVFAGVPVDVLELCRDRLLFPLR
ncbi:hypothetical protein GCM10023176_33630 [Micromonospora coerulea]|uniref:Helix-hairpin-helix domain-containing protein n=1 Tax=Micromonospora coerulea TaxID=47856 RepID=A0ABP8SNL8_9ACTN